MTVNVTKLKTDFGPEMAITRKEKKVPKKKKNPKEDTNKKKDGTWCFTNCTMHREHNNDMVQCHMCQVWAHYQCIDEEHSDIIGIWCCNNCRNLSDRVDLLCTHMHELRRDMATVISYARAFERNLVVGHAVSLSDTTPDSTDIKDDKHTDNAPTILLKDDLIQPTEEDDSSHRAVDVNSNLSDSTPVMNGTLDDADTHVNNDRKAVAARRLISFVDYSQFCMFSHKTSHESANNSPDAVKDDNTKQNNPPQVETKMEDDSRRHSNKHIPMPINDIYIGHVPQTFTEDAVHSFLRDINIKHIIRVSKLLTNEKHAGFRVIIGDENIKDTLYGTKKIHRDAVTMTFKEFRHNTNTHHRYRGGHNHDHNDTGHTKKIQNPRNNRHAQVEDSRINNYRSKSVTYSRSRYIKRSQLHDKTGHRNEIYKDHPQRRAPMDTLCTQSQHTTAKEKPRESTTTQKPLPSSVFTQSKPHILSDMHIIMPNRSLQRNLPSDVHIQEQQPKHLPLGSMCTHTHHPERPPMSVTLERSQTSAENHPVQSFQPGSGVYTQTPQLQGPLSNDTLPLRQRLQGPFPTCAYENSQLMQRSAYPHCPLTQRAVPRDVSQAAGLPVVSTPCTQFQQSQVYLPGSRQEDGQGAVLIQNHKVQRFQPDAISQQSRDAQIYIPATVATRFQQHQMPFQCNAHPEEQSTRGPHSERYPLSAYATPFMPDHCNPLVSDGLLESNPVQSFHPGDAVTQRPQIQGSFASQRLHDPISAATFEGSQLMQRNIHTHVPDTQVPPTQGAVLNQSAQQ